MHLVSQRDRNLWSKLVTEGLNTGEGTNTVLPFKDMSKKYGKAWIAYLQAAWACKDELTIDEFCHLNGGVPAEFVERTLKCPST